MESVKNCLRVKIRKRCKECEIKASVRYERSIFEKTVICMLDIMQYFEIKFKTVFSRIQSKVPLRGRQEKS